MAYIYDLTDTWNAGGTTFYGIKMNVTNTASASGSKLLSLQVGGSEKFGVDKDGNVGVGTSAPAVKLHVSATAPTVRIEGSANSDAGVQTKTPLADFKFGAGIGSATNCWNVYDLAANAERMRIDATGNVGIGTTDPTSILQASASSSSTGLAIAGPLPTLALYDNNGTTGTGFIAQVNTDTYVYNKESGNLLLGTTNTERMRIDDNGRVLIGQTASSNGFRLQIMGSGGAAGDVSIDSNASYGEIQSFSSKPLYINRQGNDVILNATSGSVGIGTTSPGNRLAVAGGQINTVIDDAYAIALNATTGNIRALPYASTYSGSALVAYSAGYAGLGPFSIDASRIQFWTGSTERARIDSSGNLLVGDTTWRLSGIAAAGQAIQLGSRTFIGTNGTGDTALGGLASSSYTAVYAAGSERMRIDSSGNVGIGTSSPGERFVVSRNGGGTLVALVSQLDATGATLAQFKATHGSGSAATFSAGDGFTSIGNTTAIPMVFNTNSSERMRITADGNLQLGTASLATNATNGFPYIPTCAGTPTGTPTAITGYAPMVVDSTNNKLYVYVGGAWQAMN